jgi:hypothetical protein
MIDYTYLSGHAERKKMFGIRPILTALLVILSGCTPPVIMLVNPKNGDVRRCSAAETGPGSNDFVTDTRIKACAHQWKALGYVETANLTPDERPRITPAP